MNVISYTALLYGLDYLEYAIRSVIDHVDEHHIIYSPIGAHGHRTDVPCPETRDELYAAALRGAGGKLRWHDGTWAHEGYQRDSIHQYAPDADVILVVDADEIWPEETVDVVVYGANNGGWGTYEQRTRLGGIRNMRVPMVHFWRSFYRAVLHDPAYPTRVIFPKVNNREEFTGNLKAINHMGYAQRPEIVEYKQLTHGHRGEWRKDDWFNTVFMANAQTNCHPVGSEYWNPEPVNLLDYMPSWMSEHPYAKMTVIE